MGKPSLRMRCRALAVVGSGQVVVESTQSTKRTWKKSRLRAKSSSGVELLFILGSKACGACIICFLLLCGGVAAPGANRAPSDVGGAPALGPTEFQVNIVSAIR